MIKILQERDDVVASLPVTTQDGRAAFVEHLHLSRLVHNSHDGTTQWSQPSSWYRFEGIEVSLQGDGTWVSAESPRLLLTPR
ncbi:MAG: hypothetical protein RL375_2969 [Pseudomonadota bacterium]|jgi:hypothetical protein